MRAFLSKTLLKNIKFELKEKKDEKSMDENSDAVFDVSTRYAARRLRRKNRYGRELYRRLYLFCRLRYELVRRDFKGFCRAGLGKRKVPRCEIHLFSYGSGGIRKK